MLPTHTADEPPAANTDAVARKKEPSRAEKPVLAPTVVRTNVTLLVDAQS